jgi:hypothetical protein
VPIFRELFISSSAAYQAINSLAEQRTAISKALDKSLGGIMRGDASKSENAAARVLSVVEGHWEQLTRALLKASARAEAKAEREAEEEEARSRCAGEEHQATKRKRRSTAGGKRLFPATIAGAKTD